MEVDKTYASKGVAGAALGTGIAGLSLGVLNGMGGLFNNNGCGGNWGLPYNNGCCCSDDRLVNRYELKQSDELAAKDSEIALLKSNIFTDQKITDVFERLSTRIRGLENQVNQNTCDQAVTNQRFTDNLAFVDNKIDTAKNDVLCYVKATYVPGKLVMPLDSICPEAMPLCPPVAKAGK